jgi:hypothetical protein
MVDLEHGKRRSTQFSAVVALEDYIEECTVMLKRAAQLRAARSQNSNPIQIARCAQVMTLILAYRQADFSNESEKVVRTSKLSEEL